MRVVMAGVASRHDLPLDALDDVELAVETLLADEPPTGGDLELRVAAEGGSYRVWLAGLENQQVRKALTDKAPAVNLGHSSPLHISRLLSSLVDDFTVETGPGSSFIVCLEKRISA